MESSKQVNFRSIATLALAVLYLINEIIKVEWLGLVTGFLLVGVLSLSLLAVEGASRAIGIGLFVVGGIIFTWLGAEPALWFQGLNRNLYLLAMFILVPLLGAPIRQGGYMETLRSFFRQYIRVDSLFYLLVKSFTLFIAVMINVAVIPLMHQIGLASDKSSNSRLMAVSLSRGFAASIIWAPSYAAVALVLELSGARWIDLFPYGLGLGVGAILLGSLMTRIEGQQGKTEPEINQQEAIQQSLGEQSEGVNWEKIAELGFFGLVLIGGIVVASQLTGIATVTVVSMAAIIFPVVWLAAIGCLPRWWTEVRGSYFHIALPKVKNEVVLFAGAGFLATAIDISAFSQLAPIVLERLVGDSPLFLSLVIISLVVLLSALGVHPIITVTVIGSILQAEYYHVTPTFIALILTTGWALGAAVSPSSATNISVASLVDRSVLEVSRWNLGYTFILFVLTWVVLNLAHWLGHI